MSLEGEWSGLDGRAVRIFHSLCGYTPGDGKSGIVAARLRIINNRTEDSSLLVYTHASDVRILVNGRERVTSHLTGPGGISPRYPLKVRYRASIDDEIILYMSKDYPYELKILLGSDREIQRWRDVSQGLDFFIIAALLLNVFFQVVIFLLWNADRKALWFGLTTLTFMIRAGLKNEKLFMSFFPSIGSETLIMIDCLNVLAALPVMMMFFHHLYPNRISTVVARMAAAIAVIYAFIVAFLPSAEYCAIFQMIYLIILLVGLYMVRVSYLEFREGNKSALLSGAGLVVFLFTMIIDTVYSRGSARIYNVTSLGMLIFNIFIILDLAVRARRAFERVKHLRMNLELEVERRTEELQRERDRLHDRKVLVDREFELAWGIQRELIPLTSPVGFISTLYRPMEMIGGDFFDFLRFRDSDRIGIFISDVSGHGVPAALVTSMLKSFVLQAGQRRENPWELMRYLNSHLMGKTGGNFITALYMIYDPAARELVFCNAGHHYPLLVTERSVQPLAGPRSVPLALFTNEFLEGEGKTYCDYRLSLPERSQVLLYTDGLTEATPDDSTFRYFEDDGFHDLLISLAGKDSAAMVGGIYKRLVEFRGAENFDDDVCIICIDIR